MTHIRPTREIAALVALIGDRATLDLLEAYAGLRIQVPVRATETSVLTRTIGLKAARALVREFGGGKLSVPLAKRWRMLHLREAGLSYRQIARRVGTMETVVFRALADAGMTQQLELRLDDPLPRQG